MPALTIGKLARAGGVGVETVRYYQRRGLLEAPQRLPGGGSHHYRDTDLRRLRFIRSAQAAGFTLEQIGELLQLDAGTDRSRARELAHQQGAALDLKIEQLTAARNALRKLAGECASGGSGPCPIIAAFENA